MIDSNHLRALGERLATDFPFFAKHCLRIKDKSGLGVPLVLNRAQLYIHARAEAQLAKRGYVRMIVVKGRQQGSSTVILGRGYWLAATRKIGTKVGILTHHMDSTNELFGRVRDYLNNHPEDLGRPPANKDSAKGIAFIDNGASYVVATAGSKDVGRGFTVQFLHGSEVAMWDKAHEIVPGIMQSVGKFPGTEVYLESTAKGKQGFFYTAAMQALRGESDFELVFVPWFWDEGYKTPCPSTFHPSEEWLDYARANRLQWDQLFWAYNKNIELIAATGGDPDRISPIFKQEYPSNAEEAFQSSGDSFIPSYAVAAARNPIEPVIGHGPVIIGVDPARSVDKAAIIDRCGNRMGERICERFDPQGSLTFLADHVASVIDRYQPDAVNIDVGGNGAAIYDILHDRGYGDVINAVNFGGRAHTLGQTGQPIYANRRAEMYDLMRQWFMGDLPVQIPNHGEAEQLHSDLCAPMWGPSATRYNTSNALLIEPKDKIKERIGASPDLGDAAALTFALPMASKRVNNAARYNSRPNRVTGY